VWFKRCRQRWLTAGVGDKEGDSADALSLGVFSLCLVMIDERYYIFISSRRKQIFEKKTLCLLLGK